MKWIRTALIAAAAAIMTVLGPVAAQATVYYWANTEVDAHSFTATVQLCNGRVVVLPPLSHTPANVCAIYVPYERTAQVWVRQTGTTLINYGYCGSRKGRWLMFTSTSDTSRTAHVYIHRAWCA